MKDKRFNRTMYSITITLVRNETCWGRHGEQVQIHRSASFYGKTLALRIFSAMVKILFSVNTLGDPK